MIINELKNVFDFLGEKRKMNFPNVNSFQKFITVTSVYLNLFFCAVITANLLIRHSIQCTSSENSYLTDSFIESFCWNENLFSIPSLQFLEIHETIPYPGIGNSKFNTQSNNNSEETTTHRYYQWVPILMIFQVVLSLVPICVWNSLDNEHFSSVMKFLPDLDNENDVMKSKIERIINYFKTTKTTRKCLNYYLRFIIFLMIHVTVTFGSLIMTEIFLSNRFFKYGVDMTNYLLYGGEMSPIHILFPRLVKCNIKFYGNSGTIQTNDVLCFLGSSVWHGYIFYFLWWWIIFSICLSILILLHDTFYFSVKYNSLLQSPQMDTFDRALLKNTLKLLNMHDILFLYMIKKNTCDFIYSQIIDHLVKEHNTISNHDIYSHHVF